MLLVFVATKREEAPPELPDLHVKDTATLQNVSVAGVFGWDGDFLQTQTITNAPMVFITSESSLGAGDSTADFWCRRLSKILLNCRFSESGANAVIRPIYKDSNDVKAFGDDVTITANSEIIDSDYGAPIEKLDTLGANKVGFKVISVSSGTVKIYAAGV